jgi:aarF domain-containing kinase
MTNAPTPAITLASVLEALPEDIRSGEPPALDLSALFAAAALREVPVGRMSRFWTLGTLQGKIAAAYTFWWLRAMWADADTRQKRLNEAHLNAAVKLLGTMSHLRGAVMKVGQLLAHWPGVAPEDFADVLGRLQFQAPPMHFSLLREAVRSELGDDPENLFGEFDTQACAAASLGQVHRARLKTGEPVAVKIQYPGIARTIRSDVANLRTLMAPLRMGPDGDNIHDQLRDIEAMLSFEVDYTAEAENLRRARHQLESLPEVFVPRVHDGFSTGRILTMDWVDGVHVQEYARTGPSQSERDRYGELMIRAFMRLCYRSHMLYSDVHQGNFLFMPDGRLGLIDFGCIRHYSPEEVDYLTDAEAADFESPEAVRRILIRAADMTHRQQQDKARLETLGRWYDWMCEPTRTTEVFDFSSPEYLERGMAIWRECCVKRYVRNLPVNLWIAKSFIGVRAMLLRLGARAAMGKILREETSVHREDRGADGTR